MEDMYNQNFHKSRMKAYISVKYIITRHLSYSYIFRPLKCGGGLNERIPILNLNIFMSRSLVVLDLIVYDYCSVTNQKGVFKPGVNEDEIELKRVNIEAKT